MFSSKVLLWFFFFTPGGKLVFSTRDVVYCSDSNPASRVTVSKREKIIKENHLTRHLKMDGGGWAVGG